MGIIKLKKFTTNYVFSQNQNTQSEPEEDETLEVI